MLTIKNSARFAELWAIAVLGVVTLLTGCTPPGPRALLDGERLIHEGKYGPAVEKLKLATQLLPENAQAWNHLGLASYGAGKINDAIKAYQQAISRNPNLPSPRYNLGLLYFEQSYPREAIDPLTIYTVLQPNVFEGWVRLGTAQLRAQQLDAAERSLQRALQMKPDSAEVLNNLGIIASHRRRTRDAIQFFQAAIKQNPHYPPALLNSAILCQHALAQPSMALERYNAYLKNAPSGEQAATVRETVRYLEWALRPPPPRVAAPPSPTLPDTHSTTAVTVAQAPVITNTPKPSAVSTVPPPIATVAPTNPPVVATPPASSPAVTNTPPKVAQASTPAPPPQTNLIRQPKPEPATAPAVRDEPVIPPPKTEIVKLPDDPLPQVAKDLSHSPAPAAVVAMPESNAPAPAESTASQSDEAQNPLVSKIQAPPDRGGIMDRLNPMRWFKGKDEAGATAEEPAPSAPPPARAPLPNIRTVAKAQNLEVKSPEANESYLMPLPTPVPMKRYGYRHPARPPAGDQARAQQSLAKGVEAHNERRLAEAIEQYREAVQADPASFEANYNLGLALFEMRDLEPSLSAYETALSINPTSLNARFNFALALQRGNYFQDAAGELEKLLADHAGEVRAHFTLGNLYAQQLYKLDRARFHYRKVLELDPRHPQAVAIRHWLASNP